jgi:glycosyltransferase involved in cell wall biosynthesis
MSNEGRVLTGQSPQADLAPNSPLVSIILPTYNRAKFLPKAIESICAQTFIDWELIIVDDGSTDNTREILPALCEGIQQSVRYIRQENQGAYGARNTGLDKARGEYIAFYDSDDVWLPHHLKASVQALETNPDLHWVYGSSRVIEHASEKVLADNGFYVDGQERAFLRLRTRPAGSLKIIKDSAAVECAIYRGLYAGLQVSVMRRCIFETFRFEATRRNEAEDQLLVIYALATGRRLGYFDNVHLLYHIHEHNSSATDSRSLSRYLRVFRALVDGYESLRGQVPLTPRQIRVLNRRLSGEYFWHLGYKLLWHPEFEAEARVYLARGLRLWPTNLGLWKTYLLSRLRMAARRLTRKTLQANQNS